jgi:hypothetical protein
MNIPPIAPETATTDEKRAILAHVQEALRQLRKAQKLAEKLDDEVWDPEISQLWDTRISATELCGYFAEFGWKKDE